MSSIVSSTEVSKLRIQSPEKLSSPKLVKSDFGAETPSFEEAGLPNLARSYDSSTQDNTASILSMSLTADISSPKVGSPTAKADEQLPNLLAAALVTALQDAALGNPALLLQHLLGFGPDDYNDLLAALSEPGSSYVGIIAAYLHNLRVVAEDHVAGNSGSTCISESINQILIAKYTDLLGLVQRMKQANAQARGYATHSAARSVYSQYPAMGYYQQASYAGGYNPNAYLSTEYVGPPTQLGTMQQQLVAAQVSSPYASQLQATYQQQQQQMQLAALLQQQQQQQQQHQQQQFQSQVAASKHLPVGIADMHSQSAAIRSAAARTAATRGWPAAQSGATHGVTSLGYTSGITAGAAMGKAAAPLNLEQLLVAMQYGGYQ